MLSLWTALLVDLGVRLKQDRWNVYSISASREKPTWSGQDGLYNFESLDDSIQAPPAAYEGVGYYTEVTDYTRDKW